MTDRLTFEFLVSFFTLSLCMSLLSLSLSLSLSSGDGDLLVLVGDREWLLLLLLLLLSSCSPLSRLLFLSRFLSRLTLLLLSVFLSRLRLLRPIVDVKGTKEKRFWVLFSLFLSFFYQQYYSSRSLREPWVCYALPRMRSRTAILM